MQQTETKQYGYNKIDEMVEDYKKSLDKIWAYITNLKQFGNECKCKEETPETSFHIIDFTDDVPSVVRYCLDCGGYRLMR